MRREVGLLKALPPSLDEIMALVPKSEEIAVDFRFDKATLFALDWLADHVGQSREGMLTNLVIDKYLKIQKLNGSGSK